MSINPDNMNRMQYFSQPCPPMPLCIQMPQYPPVMQLAKAYVPFQYLNCVYPPMQGLERYTIFPELDRPYGVDPEYTVDA